MLHTIDFNDKSVEKCSKISIKMSFIVPRFMRESMFAPQNGDQPNVKNIGIVLTDGKSNSEEETWKVTTATINFN